MRVASVYGGCQDIYHFISIILIILVAIDCLVVVSGIIRLNRWRR